MLYIEDNASNVELLTAAMLRRPMWRMAHAANGSEGVQLATADIPTERAAILLDLHLPDIDGTHVLHSLKHNPLTADIPVAILSADASPSQAGQMLAAGAEQYLTKPLGLADLFAFLDANADTVGAPTLVGRERSRAISPTTGSPEPLIS